MKHIKFNKTICGVDFLLNIVKQDVDYNILSNDLLTADFFQVVFINKGGGVLRIDDKNIALKNHSIVFISKNQKYQWIVDKNALDAHFLIFQEDFLNEFFSDTFFSYRLLYFYQKEFPLILNKNKEELDNYLSHLEEIKQELITPSSDSVHLIRSILYYVLIKLNREYAQCFQIKSIISKDNTAYQFRKLVEEHIYSKQRIEDYTSLLNVSRITLNKIVKNQFNVTTSEFLKSRIVYEAKLQLIYSDKTIDELADLFHFSAPNHFTRFFKTQTGLSPTQYKLDYQNGS